MKGLKWQSEHQFLRWESSSSYKSLLCNVMALVGLQVDLGRFSSDYMNTGFWAGQVVSTVKCSFSKAIGKNIIRAPFHCQLRCVKVVSGEGGRRVGAAG